MDKNTPLNDSIEAMNQAIKSKNNALLNVFTNRLISDSVFLENLDYNLLGIFIKEAISYANKIEDVEDNKDEFFKVIKSMIEQFEELENESPPNKTELMWGTFSVMYSGLTNLSKTKEEIHYNENLEYSNYSVRLLIEFLENEFNNFNTKKRPLIFGITREINRIFMNYGFKLNNLKLLLYLLTYNRIIDEIIFSIDIYNNSSSDDVIKNEFIKKSTDFFTVIKDFMEDEEKFSKNIKQQIFNISKKWRFNYLLYQETNSRLIERRIPDKPKEPIVIPDEAKEKLDKIVSKTIHKKGGN